MAKLAVNIYANALFEIALEKNQIESFQKELFFVVEAFEQYPDLFQLCRTPKIGLEEKKDIITKIFSDKLSEETINFLKILIDKKRIGFIKGMAREYRNLANEYKNIVEGVAVTAVALKEKDKVKLEERLGKLTGKTIQLSNEIDPSIIGGMLVRVGDRVIDGTVQRRLGELKESFAQIIV